MDLKYDIYSSVIDEEFGHFKSNIPYTIGINDTIENFKEELGTLIYSVVNNDSFFISHCGGDTSFKNFILTIKTVDTSKEVMEIEKLKQRTKVNINLDKLIESENWHHKIDLSKIVLNKAKDKAILYITENSSGSWCFVQLINKKWTVTQKILTWVA